MKVDNPLKWHLIPKQLTELFKHTNIAIGIIDDSDDNRSRTVIFARGIKS